MLDADIQHGSPAPGTAFLHRARRFMYVFTCPVFLSQNAGPYAPTKDTYYEKEALPKGPLTNVKVRDNISVYARAKTPMAVISSRLVILECAADIKRFSSQVQYPLVSWS